MARRVSWEEAQERLDKFNMTLIIYNGMSKPCVVECNGCGDIIEFKSCVNATTEINKYGGNGGCWICKETDIEKLKIRLTRCEYKYYELLEQNNEEEILAEAKTFEEMKCAIDRIEYLRKSIHSLENRINAIKNRIDILNGK